MQNELLAQELATQTGLSIHPRSAVQLADLTFFLTTGEPARLGVLAPSGHSALADFTGETTACGSGALLLGPADHANAVALRAKLTWLQPQPLGLATSAGVGDRMGQATPGHVRAAHTLRQQRGSSPAMIFAQQSIREMTRTARTPDNVLDDATWGAFQEGWTDPVGADADHLKTTADVDSCEKVGYSFFTVDPGDHVDASADTAGEAALRSAYAALPWAALDSSPADCVAAYAGRPFDLGDRALTMDESDVVRAAVKYGRVITHTVAMYRHLCGRRPRGNFELEMSVDETATPTSHGEHLYIASELKRLGVRWVSLAPRFVGSFQKGVDYIGDIPEFTRDFAGHAAIARAFGPYKISLHSGSDKFSIYPIAAQYAGGLVHLKTAGTSYLEALRTIAVFDPALFREIYQLACARWETDQASYHVSAKLEKVQPVETLQDAELPGTLDEFDARQVLHIGFGSVLNSPLGVRLRAAIRQHAEQYYDNLERHFLRHLEPLLAA